MSGPSTEALQGTIDQAWEARAEISPASTGAVREAVEAALASLDSGAYRVAEKIDGRWVTHQWLKKAVLLSFRLNDMTTIPGGPGETTRWWDKVPSKFAGWGAAALIGAPAFNLVARARSPSVSQNYRYRYR